MAAKNLKQLEQMMMRALVKSATAASKKMLTDMQEETADFYRGGEPKKYQRTGALGDSPRVSPITTAGNEISFEAYLDQSHQYTTGSKPNMASVLQTANYGTGNLRPAVGKQGFWERAEEKMEKTFNDTMRSSFK